MHKTQQNVAYLAGVNKYSINRVKTSIDGLRQDVIPGPWQQSQSP